MDLLAVTLELTEFHLKAAGAISAVAGVILLVSSRWGTIKGLFSKVSLPSIGKAEDPRVCMMNDWDCLKGQLLEYTSTDIEKVEEFDEVVWGTIRKIEAGE